MSKTQVVTTRLDEALLAQIDDLAIKLDRSRSWIVKRALTRMIEEEAALDSFIAEGAASAMRGELYSQDEMEAWFEARTAAYRTAAE